VYCQQLTDHMSDSPTPKVLEEVADWDSLWINHPCVNPKMWAILIDWITEVISKTSPCLLSHIVQLLCAYLRKTKGVERQFLQLVGISCAYISSELYSMYPLGMDFCVYICDNTYTTKQILTMLSHIIEVLGGSLWASEEPFGCSRNVIDPSCVHRKCHIKMTFPPIWDKIASFQLAHLFHKDNYEGLDEQKIAAVFKSWPHDAIAVTECIYRVDAHPSDTNAVLSLSQLELVRGMVNRKTLTERFWKDIAPKLIPCLELTIQKVPDNRHANSLLSDAQHDTTPTSDTQHDTTPTSDTQHDTTPTSDTQHDTQHGTAPTPDTTHHDTNHQKISFVKDTLVCGIPNLRNKTTYLGSGTYGRVYKGKVNDKIVAFKQFNEIRHSLEKHQLREIATAAHFGNFPHPHIMSTTHMSISSSCNRIKLVMPLMELNLFDYMQKHVVSEGEDYACSWAEKWIKPITRAVCSAIKHMHGMGLVHRDIKTPNILVGHIQWDPDSPPPIKVCDFGSVRPTTRPPYPSVSLNADSHPSVDPRLAHPEHTSEHCTLPYRAPEGCFDSETYNMMTADIWSIGATVMGIYYMGYPWVLGNIQEHCCALFDFERLETTRHNNDDAFKEIWGKQGCKMQKVEEVLDLEKHTCKMDSLYDKFYRSVSSSSYYGTQTGKKGIERFPADSLHKRNITGARNRFRAFQSRISPFATALSKMTMCMDPDERSTLDDIIKLCESDIDASISDRQIIYKVIETNNYRIWSESESCGSSPSSSVDDSDESS
jgi:serine/threonine protein kinase